MNELLYMQTQVNLFLQNLGSWTILPMRVITFLGQIEFFILVIPFFYWCVDAGTGLRVGGMLLFSGSINTWLKWSFHLPRPYWVNPAVKALVSESSFGLPSNHAQIATSMWGVLASRTRWRFAWLLSMFVAFLIGLSRLFLGVHFLMDVLAGWLIGGLLLAGYLHWEAGLIAWIKKRSLGAQAGFALSASLIILLVGGGILYLLRGYQIPPDWLQNTHLSSPETVLDPLNPKDLITAAGFVFGMGFGAAWMGSKGGFDPRGKDWHLVLRYLIGLFGIIVIWFGLAKILPSSPDWAGYISRYGYNALTGLWISALAPILFKQLGLLSRG